MRRAKRILAIIICCILCLQVLSLPAKAWTVSVVPGIASVGANTSNSNHNYSAYWQYWSQGASKYQKMRDAGCRVVAQAKLLVETGAASADVSVFNPDIYLDWGMSQGFWPYASNNILEQTATGQAAITYASNQGVTLSQGYVGLSGSNSASDVQTVMDYINAGYYVILHADAHQAYVGRAASLNAGTPVILDSWYSHSYTPSLCQTYSGYTLVNFSGFYYYAVNSTIPVTMSWLNGTQTPYDTNFYAYIQATANVSGTFTEAGITVWDKDLNIVAQKVEYPSYTNNMMEIWYNITDELGVTLQKGTTYTYQYHTRFNDTYYYSPVFDITTTGLCASHTFGDWTVTTAATCTTDGSRTRGCSVCGYTETEVLSATGHDWAETSHREADCRNPASHTYTCRNCQETNVVADTLTWSDWSETYPEVSGPVESKLQYSYRDRESNWNDGEIRTLDYATDWYGFDTSLSYYGQYNKTPVTEYETDAEKLTILSNEVVGYLYHHWCRNYQYGPLNRRINSYYTDTYWMPHVFYSTEDAALYDHEGAYGEGAYYIYNADCCKDSWWYVRIPVYRQTYLVQTRVQSGENWTEWSTWSDEPAAADQNREVRTRNVYRYVTDGLGDHAWSEGIVTREATCTEVGEISYTCAVCEAGRVEEIPAKGHSYDNGYCAICGGEDPDYEFVTAIVSADSISAAPGETVRIPVTITDNPGFAGFTFVISYDSSAMTLTDISRGEVLLASEDGALMENVNKGLITYTDILNVYDDGVLLYLEFQVAQDVPDGDYTVSIGLRDGESTNFVDENSQAQRISFRAGTVTVGSGITQIVSGWSGATEWTLTSDGVLRVYGSGNMRNYGYSESRPWERYAQQITQVVVENGVSAIGECVFKGLTKLESVTLPDKSLTKIGEAAFYGCSSLKEIAIPEGIYTIWEYTFKNCSGMESVKLPKTLIKIDQGAFENCTSLAAITIPTKVDIIGSWSFKGCTGLKEADMTWADATKIREGAFKNCSALTTIHLPVNIQILGDSCFYGIGAATFTVPDTVTKIEDWCFARAYSLTEIIFEGNAPAIGTGAFNKITLTAYYPSGNATWTSAIMQNYGGTVTWEAK